MSLTVIYGVPQVGTGTNGDYVVDESTGNAWQNQNGTWVLVSGLNLAGLPVLQGPIGLVGPIGPQGVIGPVGPTGTQGDQGPIGLTGNTGPAGPTGLIGPIGPTGLTGDTGPVGATGAIGPQGPIGLIGPMGQTGPQGPPGVGPYINVVAANITPSNSASTNDTNIAALITSFGTNGAALYFPSGVYNFSKTIDFSSLKWITLLGDGFQSAQSAGSVVTGSVNGNLVNYNKGGGVGTFNARYMNFRNTNPTGTTLNFWGLNQSSVECCEVAGNNGIVAAGNMFSFALRSVNFNGSLSTFPNGRALYLKSGGGAIIDCCDVVGWAEGFRLCGSGISVKAGRFENHKTAFTLGMDDTGGSWVLNSSSIEGVSMEAADVFFLVKDCNDCAIKQCGADGNKEAPSGQTIYGLRIIGNTNRVSFENFHSTGGFTQDAISAEGATANQMAWKRCTATNTLGKGWNIPNPGTMLFEQCNYP